MDSDRFPEIGQEMEVEERVVVGGVGSAQVRYFSQRMAVDFAEAWLARPGTSVPAS